MSYHLKFSGLAIEQAGNFSSHHPWALFALGSFSADLLAGVYNLAAFSERAVDILAFHRNNEPPIGDSGRPVWKAAVEELEERLSNARQPCRFRVAYDVSWPGNPPEELLIEAWFEEIPRNPVPGVTIEVWAYLLFGAII